jgi:rhodanese-related sulfurtransferase
MNDAHVTERGPGTGAVMVVMLVASLALGLAYNTASPLGVHAVVGPQADASTSVSVQVKKTGYFNETVSMTLEGTAGGPANHALTIPTVTWPEVKALLARHQIVLVDARGSQYFQSGAIPGAVSLPGPTFPSAIGAFLTSYASNTPLVIYCTSPQCPLASEVAQALVTQYGYANVKIMPGGYQEYTLAENGKGDGTGTK